MYHLLCALIHGFLAPLQIQFYLTAKNRSTLLIQGGMTAVFVYVFFLLPKGPIRAAEAFAAAALFIPVVLSGYREKLFCKLYNLFIQAAVISVSILSGELAARSLTRLPPDAAAAAVSAAIAALWTVFMYFMRLRSITIMPFDEERYVRCFVRCTLIYAVSVLCCPSVRIVGETTVIHGLPLITAVVSLCSIVAIILMFAAGKKSIVRRQQLDSVFLQRDLFKQQLSTLMESQRQMRIIQHDYKHYLAALDSLLSGGETGRAAQLLEEQVRLCDENAPSGFCSDPLIDAVLVDFAARARESGIDFSADCRIGEKVAIRDIDLAALLFNGLNNAFEACNQIAGDGQKAIRFSLLTAQGLFVVKITNTIADLPKIVRNHIASTKDMRDRPRGIGLVSMDSIASRYGGRKTLSAADGVFLLEIVMDNFPPKKKG